MKLKQRLCSGLCVAAMLVSLLPALGVSAADTALKEDFESVGVGSSYTDDLFRDQNLDYGGKVQRVVKEENGNRYLEMSTQNTASTSDTPRNRMITQSFQGTYTLEFDYNHASPVRFDVYLRTGGNVRLLISAAGVPSITVLPAASVPGKMVTAYSAARLDPSRWYTMKVTVTDEKITLDVYDKTDRYLFLDSISIGQDASTLPNLLDPYPIWFDMWGLSDLVDPSKAVVNLDNITVTTGTYEGLVNGEARLPESGGTTSGTVKLIGENFESSTAGARYTNENFSASDLAYGGIVSRQVRENSGNKYLEMATQNTAETSNAPRVRLTGVSGISGTYTVEWDYNTHGKTRFDVYLRAGGAIRTTVTEELNPTIRVLDSAKVAGKMETAVGKTTLKTDHWYTFKATMTDKDLTLEIFDKEKDNLLLETLTIPMDTSTLGTLLGESKVWFDMWGYSDVKNTQATFVALDNVNIVLGTYEGLLNAEAKVGSTTPITGDGLGSDISLLDHACPAENMLDVYQSAWYHRAVDYVLTNKLMNGFNAAIFGTNSTLTRAQVVQVLYNKEGQPAVSGKHGFSDVPATQWYNNAVTWGTQKGVMSGYGGGKFGPEDTVTVEQVAVILWNYAGNPTFTGTADSVGPHSGWAANALAWAVQNGLFDGMPYDAVTDAATRAQTAQMLMNYLSK